MTADREARARAAMDEREKELKRYVPGNIRRLISDGYEPSQRLRWIRELLGCIEDARATLDLHREAGDWCAYDGLSYPCQPAKVHLDRWAPETPGADQG